MAATTDRELKAELEQRHDRLLALISEVQPADLRDEIEEATFALLWTLDRSDLLDRQIANEDKR